MTQFYYKEHLKINALCIRLQRANALGLSSVVGRLGSIMAPMMLAVKDYISWWPEVFMGCLGLIAAVVAVTFPETTGMPMMNTLEEVENFYRKRLVVFTAIT